MPHDEVIAPEAAIDEAACLQELSDIKDNHGPYSPEALSCLSKLCDFYKRAGEIATLESVLQQILKHDERTAGCFHSDTIATSLSLTNVYIQRGKSTEALSLLHRLVESSLKLGVDSESETRAVYKTENDATKLTVLQLGFEMGKRNYHNGAVDVLERAFGHFSTALGDCHADTVAVGNLLSLSYVQQFVQPPLREDRPRHHCIVKLAQLCERIFEVDRSPIWTLGLMCLRSNDRTNASFAFRQAPGSASCDVCKEIIKPSTQWLACKPCLLVSVCNNCYLKWTTRTNQDEPITPTCAGHQFYIVEAENLEQASTGSIDNEDPVRAWLRKLIEQKTQLATTVAFLDHWECLGKPEELLEFRNPVYFLESDSLPALVDEMRATSSPVQRLEWYKSWLTHSVPILQDLFFGSKGQRA